ncbi:MAG: arylesterase [bacterium]|nr:arylesterase [bacterium]
MSILSLYIRSTQIFALALFGSLLQSIGSPSFAGAVKLVVLGDSLSAGYHLPQGSGFPKQLQWRLNKDGYQVKITNAGISGDTTAGGLARLSWSVPKGTHAVIVELGANDALRGVNPKQTYKNLDKLIGKLRKRGIKVLLAGMEAPRNLGAPYVKTFGAIYPALAKKYHISLYPFFLKGVALQKRLLLSDGLHPNEKGVAMIVKNIKPYVERLIRQAERSATR